MQQKVPSWSSFFASNVIALVQQVQKIAGDVNDDWLDEFEVFLTMLKNKDFNLPSRLRAIEKDFIGLFKKSSDRGYVPELQALHATATLLFHSFVSSKQLADSGIFPQPPKELEEDICKLLSDIEQTIESEVQEHGTPNTNAQHNRNNADTSIGTHYPMDGNILYVNNMAALDSNEIVLQELENLFPGKNSVIND